MSGRGIASFAAGFGTGYLNAKQKQKEDERQKKIDDRAEIEWNDKQAEKKADAAFEAERVARFTDDTASRENIQIPNGAPAMSSVDPTAPTLLPANPATQGLTQPVTKELTQKTAKPLWKKIEEQAYANLGNKKYANEALSLLEQSQVLKSKEYQNQINDAYGKGEQALLDLANNHPNNELPYNNLSLEPSADGKTFKLSGKTHFNGEEKDFSQSIPLQDGMTAKDWLFKNLMDRTDPQAMMNSIKERILAAKDAKKEAREDIKFERDGKKSDAELEALALNIKEGKIRLESLPESIQLDLKAKKANIAESNATADVRRASAAKIRKEDKDGGDNLPTSVKEALWYQSATPEQKSAFNEMNDKSPKVTADGVGGFIINKKDGMYKMDRKGDVSKVAMPDGKAKPVPKNRPPLSSFNK